MFEEYRFYRFYCVCCFYCFYRFYRFYRRSGLPGWSPVVWHFDHINFDHINFFRMAPVVWPGGRVADPNSIKFMLWVLVYAFGGWAAAFRPKQPTPLASVASAGDLTHSSRSLGGCGQDPGSGLRAGTA